jgi:hypothetical protein
MSLHSVQNYVVTERLLVSQVLFSSDSYYVNSNAGFGMTANGPAV